MRNKKLKWRALICWKFLLRFFLKNFEEHLEIKLPLITFEINEVGVPQLDPPFNIMNL